MLGIRSMDLTVTHNDPPDDEFDPDTQPVATDNHVQCIVERVNSLENTAQGSGSSANLIVQVHVKKPVVPNVSVGDTFHYGSSEYTVTAIDDGIMKQNRVGRVPYVWRFRGEVLKG